MTRPVRRAKGAEGATLALSVDRTSPVPLSAQIAAQIRSFVLSGRVTPGARLPSTRALAVELGIARATAVLAAEQLVAEGYVEGRAGAGLFVSRRLPEQPFTDRMPRRPEPRRVPPASAAQPASWLPFAVGALDPALFPHEGWARLLQRGWRDHGAELLRRVEPFGWPPLRAAIARHLREWRAIDCDAAQIVVTSGIADAIGLIAAIAFRPGDRVVVEDPGYPAIREELARRGLRAVSLRVDASGLDAARIAADPVARKARGAFVTPARQHPLGGSMPVDRRLALLNWAAQAGGMVVEDEFDGEYRYAGAPLPALTSLDRDGRVVHVGSFSKVLSGSLRLGYVVLPPGLIGAAHAALGNRPAAASIVAQPALAEFLASGDFAAHVRRTRRIYARRLAALLDAGRHWSDHIAIEPTDAGLHVVARFGPRMARMVSDREVAAAAREAGIVVAPLSASYARAPRGRGLLLGFAGFPEETLVVAMNRLGGVVRRLSGRPRRVPA
jgi:GntR family transcriptional regulator/MocR family aminotransferase